MSDHRAIFIRRAAAVIALGALVAIVPVLLVGVVGDLGAVLVALLGLVVIVLGAWDVLTRRGAARSVALGVATVGLGVLLFGVLSADLSVWRIVAIALLGVLSIGTARLALGRDPRPDPSCTKQTGDAGPPSGPDHEPEVRRGQGRALQARGGVHGAGDRAHRAQPR